jgi:serine/threonine protein kinase
LSEKQEDGAMMGDATLVDDLLSAWLERFVGGEDVPASALCPDRPDLRPELERRIEAQRRMLALAHALSETDSSTVASPDPDSTSAERAGEIAAPPGITVPGYEVLARLGQGGMGSVYRARHIKLKRVVALKVLRAERLADPEHRRRVLAEAEAIARLQHPNIVQIYDVNEWQPAGSEAPQPYLALEYVVGGTLGRVLEDRGALEPSEAARLVRILAHAVHAAHRAGIVHRDLKPANVLLAAEVPGSPDNLSFGFPKITDFGLARLLDVEQRHTLDGQVMGSPPYMAPEQAEGRPEVGPSADIWALGVILYECLTGRQPFQGPSALATLELVRSSPPPPPRSPRGEVPAALEAICLRCLRKDPADRYPSAAALAEELGGFLAGETISARPEAAEPPQPDRRRRLWPIVAAALVLVAGAAVVLAPRRRGHKPPEAIAALAKARPSPSSPSTALKGSIDIVVYGSAVPGPDDFKPSKARQRLRLHNPWALPLRPNDWIRIEAQMNRPAYLYVVWIDTDGKATPLWPWKKNDWAKLPAAQIPRDRLALPESESGHDIMPLSGGPPGIESLLLLTRDTPLTAAENAEVTRILSRPLPRRPMAWVETEIAIWLENGERVTDEPNRAPILSKAQSSGDPEVQVRSVMKQLLSLFPYTRAVFFGNQGSR